MFPKKKKCDPTWISQPSQIPPPPPPRASEIARKALRDELEAQATPMTVAAAAKLTTDLEVRTEGWTEVSPDTEIRL